MLGRLRDMALMGKAEAEAESPKKAMSVPKNTAIHGNRNPLRHIQLLRQEPPLRHPRQEHPVIAVRILFRHPVRGMLGTMRDMALTGKAEAAVDGPKEAKFIPEYTAVHGNSNPLR
jgi:hypothetical protein